MINSGNKNFFMADTYLDFFASHRRRRFIVHKTACVKLEGSCQGQLSVVRGQLERFFAKKAN